MEKTTTKDDVLLVQEAVLNTTNLLRQHLSGKRTSKEYIHQIRVDIKHLRAWLRLQQNKADKKEWKKTDQRLSECAKQLGSIRDEQAISKSLDCIYNKAKTKGERAAITSVKKQLISKLTNTTTIPEQYNNELLESLDLFEQKFVTVNSIAAFKKGLNHSFKKCEHFAEKAFSNKGNDKDLHKLRKWIKNFYYQSSYISNACPIDKKLKKDIHKLGNKLGEAHDLVIIKDRLDSLEETDFIKKVYSLIDKNIALIVKNAERDYKKLFYSPELKTIL